LPGIGVLERLKGAPVSSWKRFALVWAVAALALAASAGTATARTLVVQPGQSIQRHVDRARVGDTVLVRSGTYRESVEINKGITLQGQGSVLKPGPEGDSLCNRGAPNVGICVHGKLDFSQGEPTLERRVAHVSIRGLNIRGFGGDGIFGFGTRELRIRNNRFVNNGGYGVFSLLAKRTHLVHNIAEDNDDFGLYVGDSRKTHSVVRNNRAVDNHGGILIRASTIGRVTHNVVAGNCVGIQILGDAPGPTRHWLVGGNRAVANNRRCAADPEGGPAFSGLGILLVGVRDTVVRYNVVRQQRHLHPTVGSAGIAVVRGDRTTPAGVLLAHNTALNNRPNDLFWDRSGRVRFFSNLCERSSPRRVCD
jgi:nitrous oxidase accessory protein NosD